MSKVFKIIVDVILVLMIIILASYFILRITNKIRIYSVETGSMEDKIHKGDYILLYRKNNYHVGDVITYKVDNYFITHRIVKMDGNKITTKGDANNSEDEEININQVEGKVIYTGGILNIIINFKFVIVAFMIGLYLLSCYFEKEK
jgi:signal peptidase